MDILLSQSGPFAFRKRHENIELTHSSLMASNVVHSLRVLAEFILVSVNSSASLSPWFWMPSCSAPDGIGNSNDVGRMFGHSSYLKMRIFS